MILNARRSRERAEAAKDDIVEATNNENVHIHIVDMSRPNDIRKFVKEFDQPCHVLVSSEPILHMSGTIRCRTRS